MRIDGKGLIDRSKPVHFEFDGQRYPAFRGDTVASALLANNVKLVGRSFKYHRPRGVLTAGSEEPNALITTGSGADQSPNVRATMQEVYDGLQTQSQNNWPSLRTDILGANDLLSPWIGAGFYYKTFMWPKSFWEKIYEPFIRRAAGLGALSGAPETGRYDKAFAHCDLLIIGAGPAGLTAALMAGRAGLDVILADENAKPGGRMIQENERVNDLTGAEWVDQVIGELSSMDNVRIMSRTTITGAYDGGIYGALERVGLHGDRATDVPKETFWRITTARALLCSGALERSIAFRNNDRPGIMHAGSVRGYLNQYGVAAGKRVAVFGNNDDAHRTVLDLKDAGVNVVALIDTRTSIQTLSDVPVFEGSVVSNTRGRFGIRSLSIRRPNGRHVEIELDCLAVSGGWNPSVHLACHMGGRPVWNDTISAFVPTPNMVPGLDVAGAALGTFSTKGAMKSGQYRAKLMIESLGAKVPSMTLPDVCDAPYALDPYWAVPGKGRAWLDYQNDVTVKDVNQAAKENFRSVEHMKRYTTQGMATDQGKNSNVAALAILADATGRTIGETGTTTFRPPYSPVSIAAMGAGGFGKGFAPERFVTSHQASLSMDAPMIEAGLWYRPSYYPIKGETNWRQSCDREVNMVRQAVGITDVSTLGKIDVQGDDAAKFLDFVYTNTFSTLKVGRVRYGLMLREDGLVMDDGTSARLGQNHFVMTTTTAAAGAVMKHLEFVRQCHVPDWDVQIVSVTEQWAQFAVAGPKSRDLLNAVLDEPINDASFPFMSAGSIAVSGVQGRLFRISFSGEHAYEIAVPARSGDSLFRLLLAQATTMGGGAYGIEALNVMRIEKGFLTHAEIHGRISADDIGFGRMVSAKKDCIGKTMSERVGLHGSGREQLIGLKPVGAVKSIHAGAHLFEIEQDATRPNSLGYVTSNCFSPTLGENLGLGFLRNGRARHGERIKVVDHLRGIETICEICDPVFFDPTGERARG